MAVDNQKFEEALKNRNFEEAMTMLTDGLIQQERESAHLRKNKYQEIRERREQRVSDLAKTYQGLGLNTSTLLLALEVGSGMYGLTNKPASDAFVALFGGVRRLTDTGTEGTRVSFNHAIDEMKRLQDDLKGDDQRSSSAISELMNQIKQIHQMMHEASSQMSRSY